MVAKELRELIKRGVDWNQKRFLEHDRGHRSMAGGQEEIPQFQNTDQLPVQGDDVNVLHLIVRIGLAQLAQIFHNIPYAGILRKLKVFGDHQSAGRI